MKGSEAYEYLEDVLRVIDSQLFSDSECLGSGPVNTILEFSSSSLRVIEEYRCELEERRHPDSGDLAGVLQWAAKLDGQVARLAGLLQLLYDAEHHLNLYGPSKTYLPQNPQPSESFVRYEDVPPYGRVRVREIGQRAAVNACILADYYIEHSKRAHLIMMGKGPDGLEHGRQLLDWAKRNQDENGEFTIREAHQALRGRVIFHDAQAVHEAAHELARRGHIRLLAPEAKIGRPTSRYRLHPKYRKGAKQEGQ